MIKERLKNELSSSQIINENDGIHNWNLFKILSFHEKQKKEKLNSHLSCEQFTTVAVYARLKLSPNDALDKNDYGRSPLHYAMKQSPSLHCVIRLLYRLHPAALTTPDFCGLTPLSLCFSRNFPISILQMIMELQPDLPFFRHSTFCNKTLIESICQPWLDICIKISPAQLRKNKDLFERWNKVVTTICAAAKYKAEKILDNKNLPIQKILHVVIRWKEIIELSPQLVIFIINMYPCQVSEWINFKNDDSDRQLPFHYVLSQMGDDSTTSCKNNLLLIQTLLKVYPKAASIPISNDGQLPLHFALQKKLKWEEHGVKDIVYAYPDALSIPDIASSQMLPFMIAGNNCVEKNCANLTTTYCLLKEFPVCNALHF